MTCKVCCFEKKEWHILGQKLNLMSKRFNDGFIIFCQYNDVTNYHHIFVTTTYLLPTLHAM